MISPMAVGAALYAAWGRVPDTPLYRVPPDVPPPYGVLQVETVHPGNGLPSPFFYTKGMAEIRVWSAYLGTQQMHSLLNAFESECPADKIPCGEGYLTVGMMQQCLNVQLPDSRHQWREGCLKIPFVYEMER